MLTPEREKEIRKFLDNGSAGHPDSWYEDYKMFLSEIDRLRLAWQSDCDEFEDIEKERDHLREKLAVAELLLEERFQLLKFIESRGLLFDAWKEKIFKIRGEG